MDYEQSLRKRLASNETEISGLKERLAALELEQHKLGIALEVFASLAREEPTARPSRGRTVASSREAAKAAARPPPVPEARKGVRELILWALGEAGFPLTKMDVVSRLSAAGQSLNAATVGSTLSKLVDAGVLEKVSHSQYRAKA